MLERAAELEAREREVAEHRRAAAINPDDVQPTLAASLCGLASALWKAERPDDALTAAEEAIALARRLLAAGHVEMEFTLRNSVDILVRAAGAVDRSEVAVATVQETIDVLRPLAVAGGRTYEDVFARQLYWFSAKLRKIDPAAAVLVAEESVAVRRRHPDEEGELNQCLGNLQGCLAAAGRMEEARAVRHELRDRHQARLASLTLDSVVEEADFTIRTYNTLKRLDCHLLGDAARLSMRDLLYVRWDSGSAVEEVNEQLSLMGLGPLKPGLAWDRLPVGPPERTFGALCVRCDAEDAVAQVREGVIAAYAADGVPRVDKETHLALFAEGEDGLNCDREPKINTANRLGNDLVVVVPGRGAWITVYSVRWELAAQGRHPLALRLSSRWPVLTVAAIRDLGYELCRYHDGAPVQYAVRGDPTGRPPVVTDLDFAQLAAESWITTSASELGVAFGDPHVFGNIAGLPSATLGDTLDGWPIYADGEGDDSAVFLWREVEVG